MPTAMVLSREVDYDNPASSGRADHALDDTTGPRSSPLVASSPQCSDAGLCASIGNKAAKWALRESSRPPAPPKSRITALGDGIPRASRIAFAFSSRAVVIATARFPSSKVIVSFVTTRFRRVMSFPHRATRCRALKAH